MNELYNRIETLCNEANTNITEMCRSSGAPRGSLTDLKMGRTSTLTTNTLSKIASYFGVSVDYLLGTESEQPHVSENARQIADADIKAAFWGGEKDLAPEEVEELWQDVKDYVKFKTEQKRKGK